VRQLVEVHALAMALVSPIKLADEEKLEILQRLDRFRLWHSLDEKRYCLVCGKIITGREIQVIGSTCESGLQRIICPTEHCNAMPMDWVRPTDEVLIKNCNRGGRARRLGLINRAGRAARSLPKKNDKQYEQQNEA